MFRNIVFSAFGAALAVCLAVSALQFVTTEPLILHAEEFEGGAEVHDQETPPASLRSAPSPEGEGSEQAARPASDAADSEAGAVHPATGDTAESASTAPTMDGVQRQSLIPPGDGEGVSGHGPETGGDSTPQLHVHQDGSAHVHDEEAWAPANGFERAAFTILANLVIAFAVSLMLLGAMVLRGDPIDARRGVLWGVVGFAALSLLPALGLPPELPGTPAADIVARQGWWLGAATASAAGIALVAFGRHWALKAVGVVLLVAPHAIGAPVPPSHDVTYPGALAGEFVVASLVVSALLWSLSGLTAGWLHQRLARSG